MFGLRALTSTRKKKLDPRATECILIGYSSQTKGYRLWDLKRKQIIQTKHVQFDETKVGLEAKLRSDNRVCFEFLEPSHSETHEQVQIESPTKEQHPISQITLDDDDSDAYYSGDEESQEPTESRIVGETESPKLKSR